MYITNGSFVAPPRYPFPYGDRHPWQYASSPSYPFGPLLPQALDLTSASSTTPPGPVSSPSTRSPYPAHPGSAFPKSPYATRSDSQT